MKRMACLAALSIAAPSWAADKPQAEPMVVGTPHLANPARDIADTNVEDVLTPQRQREIEQVVERLAAFRPTHVAIEAEPDQQARLDQRYADYRSGRLKLGSDETDQIGLRLAARLGLPRVDAVDWLREAPGRGEDYDYVGWMKAHGRGAEWEAFRTALQRQADREGAFQRCHPVADWLRSLNDPAASRRIMQPDMAIATFGDGADNPGAAWEGTWYARNLRIYANLLRIGSAPGERTIAIFGAGHGPLLRGDAQASGRFTVVDVLPYLPPESRRLCTADP